MEENQVKKAFLVIDGGKKRVEGNGGGPDFGSGVKAEEARGFRKPLTHEEIDEMHRKDTPLPPRP